MWVQPKEIFGIIEAAVVHKISEVYAELDEVLAKNRSSFFTLLQNPVKNTSQREQVKQATKTGLKLYEQGNSITLKDKTVQDVLLLSDALNLNEFSCVELMIAAEQQASNFPGFSDSAIASILYHDGRRCILAALKLLLTARPGVTWTLELEDRMTELIAKFTEEIISDGLVSSILKLLGEISLTNELQKLEEARALDDGKHKNQITELIEEQQLLLADCLFACACQYPLNRNDCIKLLDYLKVVASNTADGRLDVITVRVLFALLATFNCDVMDSAVENIEDAQYQQLPFFKDRSFLSEVHKSVVRPDTSHWQTPGLKYVVQFCWGIFLRTCAAHPQLVDFEDVFEEDDGILDSAVTNNVFVFLRNNVIEMNRFYNEEYFVKFMHSFITSLIVKFPMKIKEWRNSGDENARILQAHINEGMEPPQGLRHDFKDFMDVVSALYKKDPLGLELNTEFWIPPEPMGGVFSPQPLRKYQQVIEQKKLMLNKFVRLAGDILLQTFYVSYINMLTSLSNNDKAASYCFHLLAANAQNDRGGTCAVSWDHFFNSIKQYYVNLRQNPDLADHRSHMHRHQEISPEELQGLESVLNLIKTVAEKNENVRISFCENERWLPVASLLGLVCCSVPSSLKGLLMETLAAFAKSPEIAASLWHSLEAAQLLQTHTSNNQTQKSGIAAELLEIESRNEAYPQTRGFMKLLTHLIDVKVPPTLGAGYRIPGFHPYLLFLKDDVYLSFKTRAYQNINEKWEIGCEVLQIFLKIMKEYSPQPEDFIERTVEMQGINFGKAAKPSGFQLMTFFLNDTPMLRMTLSVIDDIAQQLQGFIHNEELRTVLEDICECCLSLLECILEKQSMFIELARAHLSSLILSPLDELLLSVNPRTGKPDYLFLIGRYMTLTNIRPTIPLSVIKIFKYVCEGSKSKDMVVTLTQEEIASRELLVGFSEHLESPDPEVNEESQTFDIEEGQSEHSEHNIRDEIRQNIVRLLISTVNQPSVNLAQFLLGFEIQQPISRTNLQDPGVRGFPKTCLHSVVSILNRGVIRPDNIDMLTPKLAELLYQLVYLLCAHEEMGNPIRRYLRTNQDFFLKHMQALPFLPDAEEPIDEIHYLRLANQQSWFLKAIAINLRMVAHSRMRSALQQLIGSLFNSQSAQEIPRATAAGDPYRTIESSQTTLGDSLSRTMLASAFKFGGEEKNLILTLLSTISFTQRYPPNVNLQFFDYGAVEQLISSCEESDETGVAMCNVRKLYRVLLNEINNSQLVVGATQKLEILKEVKTVLKHAVDRNLVRQSFQAKHHAFDAWRHVVEVIFAISPSDIMAVDKKQSIIIEILQELIPKLTSNDALPELTSAVSGTVLSLMANLWFAFTQLDQNGNASENSSVTMASVTSLFAKIIEGIISVGASAPRVRANLYAAFLYYYQIGLMQSSISKEGVIDGIFGRQTKESWETTTMEILNKYGESLLDIVAKDTCQGPCIARMMSMGVMDAIASLDWKHRYLMLMTSRGYLRVLIDQLIQDDVDLQNVLSLQPQTMKPLYLFESKMSFFARFAATDYGAQTLLQLGILSRLTECQFLDFHVEKPALLKNSTMSYTSTNDPFLPSLIERYSKIFTAFMRLLLSLISSLGVHHQVAISQVQTLIMNHEDVFLTILHDGAMSHTFSSLKQLSLTISIVSLLPITDKRDDAWEILTDDQRHWRTFMNRIHRLMLTLLHRYTPLSCNTRLERVLYEANHDTTTLPGGQPSHFNILALETQNALLQIRSRALTFCKNIVSSQGLSGPYTRVMFSPSFTDNISHETTLVTGKTVSSKQLPNMSLLVEELKHCPTKLNQCLELVKIFERKIECLSDMSSDELREIISQEEHSECLPLRQKQIVARKILSKLKKIKEKEASTLIYMIEHIVYILWRHIDYYYHHCVPTDENYVQDEFSKTYQRARRLNNTSNISTSLLGNSSFVANQSTLDQTVRTTVKREEINELKTEAPSILNGKLWQSILESDRIFGKKQSRLSFTPALVHRIQSIIQLNS